jgi:hypothetical protein
VEQADLLRRVITVLDELQVPYMIVGSWASSAYGEPRLTQDIDIVVDLKLERVNSLCEAFPAPEYYVSREAAAEAVRLKRPFNVLHPGSGVKIDFVVARKDPWGQSQMLRRQEVQVLPGQKGYLACPEDVIIGKMRYYRQGGSEKHLRDIAGILKIMGEDVDRGYIAQWAEELNLTEVWETVLRRLEERENG